MSFRVTIADVAREAGVSRQTVSRVINNKGEISQSTLLRVRGVIERLGYRPSSIARGLATQKTLTVGLVVPDIANPFFAEIARGAGDVAHASGYSLLLCTTVEDPAREADVLRVLEDQSVDGIILCSSRLAEDDLVAAISRQRAVVLVNRKLPGCQCGGVWVDDAMGARVAVEHLLASGRRTIGYLAGPYPISHSSRERARGYAEALNAADGSPRGPDPALQRPCTPDGAGGRAAARELLAARPDIDAFYCHNDLIAVGALQACAGLGRRVPEDVAVVGSDDILLAGLVNPPLTTLRVDKLAIGATAMRLLLDEINGWPADCDGVVFHPELIIRASAP
jgi:LacI family transcriptional regulator